MMKKMILLLTLIAVFLLGCAPTAEDPETSATGDPGQSTALPGVIRDDSADITVVFPAGCRYDAYHGSTRLVIYLLSGRSIDLDTLQLRAHSPASCTFDAYQMDVFNLESREEFVPQYQLYHHRTLKGIDWAHAATLRKTYYDLANQHTSDPKNSELFDACFEAGEAQKAYMDQFSADFDSACEAYYDRAEPPFIYNIIAEISGSGGQLLQTLTLQVGETEYTLDVGQIRLYEWSDAPEILSSYSFILKSDSGTQQWISSWQTGHILDYLEFNATADVELTAVNILGMEGEISQDIQLVLTSQDNTMDVIWDGVSPFPVSSGTKIDMYVDAFLPDLADRPTGYGEYWYAVEFTVAGEPHATPIYNSYSLGDNNMIDLCVQFWDGVSLRSYYQDYLYTLP